MQTFLPYEDFAKSAASLDSRRLNSQINESVVVLRSNLGVYPTTRRNGGSGWADHPVARLWKNHELKLAHYGLAMATEFLKNRPHPSAESLDKRRTRVAQWTGLIQQLEERNFPEDPHPLIGIEDFHSRFRALLLFKDLQDQTFKRWSAGAYPEHAIFKDVPLKKGAWKQDFYERIWDTFGRPPHSEWYAGRGWTEEPAYDTVYYTTDQVPFMERRKLIRATKHFTPWMRKQREKNLAKTKAYYEHS